MSKFPHLTLKKKLTGPYRFTGIPIEKVVHDTTLANLNNRQGHGKNLSDAADRLKQEHASFVEERKLAGMPDMFAEDIFPVLLQIDPNDFDVEALKNFGIEIISEEEGGFVIGANADNFKGLQEKIDAFLQQKTTSKNQAAKLWQIVFGLGWRVERILSGSLKEKFVEGISDSEVLTLDISVACYVKVDERPIQVLEEDEDEYVKATEKWKNKNGEHSGKKMRPRRKQEPDGVFAERIANWETHVRNTNELKDDIALKRQNELYEFIENRYKGEIISTFVDLQDSFGFRARMSGQAFKDFLRGYAYVFEICESDAIFMENGKEDPEDTADDIEILAPAQDSPVICIIDSGIQEKHILLEPAILDEHSINYVIAEDTTSDLVKNGGHGTKVAGAVLYAENIPEAGRHQPEAFLVNARVLDKDNYLPLDLYPPELMENIIDDYKGIRLFNLSITSRGPSRTTHMSAWAASLDKLMHENDILFIVAAGNIQSKALSRSILGISDHIQAARPYPEYFGEPSSRISNPAQSLFSLSVGSVCLADFENEDRISFGKRGDISSFSRCGPGIWESVKPDVVEYGGDFLYEKNGHLITSHDSISTPVVRTGPNRVGYSIGTSFATPKVTHIAAKLARKNPEFSAMLIKALIIQSARLPERFFYQPTNHSINHFGYGIPDVKRATENSDYRITFVASDDITPSQANLYSIKVPEEIRRPGNNFEILIEVTLVYTAEPRRTRKRLKSYLSSWLTWECSKKGEELDSFSQRVLKNMQGEEKVSQDDDIQPIGWTLASQVNHGLIKDKKRQDNAAQKDWAITRSNQLPPELSFAVVGHKGWEKDTTKTIPFALVVTFEILGKEIDIYERISLFNEIEIAQEVDLKGSAI